MTKKQKKMLIRIIAAAVLLVAAVLLPPVRVPFGIPLFTSRLDGGVYAISPIWLYLAAYFTIGWDILWKAIRNIGHGQVFDENFLMCVATVGALVQIPAVHRPADGYPARHGQRGAGRTDH